MALRLAYVTFLFLLLAGSASAQRLATVLPEETVFAVGLEDLESHAGKLDDILAEAERLDLGSAFSALFGNPAEELPGGVSEHLEGVAPMDVIGRDAWLAVSVSGFNPMPAVSFIARTGGEAGSVIASELAEAAEREGATALSEGSATFYEFPIDSADSPFQVVAAGQTGDILVASTNPEVLRGMLRRLAGSSEPSFTASAGYAGTLADLGEGNSYFFLDFGRLAEALRPLGNGTGYDALIARALGGLGTFGVQASVTVIEEDGLRSTALRLPGSGDSALSTLLAAGEPASREPLAFVPADAMSVSAAHVDIPGWWNWLADLVRSSDELGNPDLDAMVMQFTGIDPQTALFGWMGNQGAVITGEMSGPVQPGMAGQNLLGETAYLIATEDEAAAQQGLSMLFGIASGMVAGFADPAGQAAPAIEQREVAGTQVTSYGLAPGTTIAFAVTDGWVVLATSDGLLDAVLEAHAAGGTLPRPLARLEGEIPSNATTYALTDLGAAISQAGSQLTGQAQAFAGLAGGEIDFDALQQASAAIDEFFSFLAARAGGEVGYSVPEAEGVSRSHTRTEFDW